MRFASIERQLSIFQLYHGKNKLANSAIYQLSHSENRIMFSEMMMRSALYYTDTISRVFFIVRAHWSNSQWIEMSPHSDTLSCFEPNILSFCWVFYVRQAIKTAARGLVLHGIASQSNRPNIINNKFYDCCSNINCLLSRSKKSFKYQF